MKPRRPEWWRGLTPPRERRLSGWVLSGNVTELDLARAHPATFESLVSLGFERAHVSGLTVPLDELHLGAMWSEFHGCTFTQRAGRLMADGSAAQGWFGHPDGPSLYRECTFSRVRFGWRRFQLWTATFENCLFDRCTWRRTEYDADLVGCTFRGPMDGGAFGGTSPETGRTNRIVGNDFSAAVIGENFAWRSSFPLAGQAWPNGYVPEHDED